MSVIVGILSDTHGYVDPKLRDHFRDVEAILHAGDVGSAMVLKDLQEIAPVYAVAGNVDAPELNLPFTRSISLADRGIFLRHILPVEQRDLEWVGNSEGARPDRRKETTAHLLACVPSGTRVCIFGHSHKPCLVQVGKTLFVNPGSAGKQRFSFPRCCALMMIEQKGIRVRFCSLENYKRSLPAERSMEV